MYQFSGTTVTLIAFFIISLLAYIIYLKKQIHWYNDESRYEGWLAEATLLVLRYFLSQDRDTLNKMKNMYGHWEKFLKEECLEARPWSPSYQYWKDLREKRGSWNNIVSRITTYLDLFSYPRRHVQFFNEMASANRWKKVKYPLDIFIPSKLEEKYINDDK